MKVKSSELSRNVQPNTMSYLVNKANYLKYTYPSILTECMTDMHVFTWHAQLCHHKDYLQSQWQQNHLKLLEPIRKCLHSRGPRRSNTNS